MTVKSKEIRNVFTYELRVFGVFGKNRKAKLGLVKLAEVPQDAPMALETVRELATKQLNEMKVKGKATVDVLKTAETVERQTHEDGVVLEIRSFGGFTTERIIHEEIGG